MRKLLVAAVQMASDLRNTEQNAARMRRWIERAADSGAHMVVFPECSLTGYSAVRASEAAISADDNAARLLEAHASALGVAVGYGFIERESPDALPFITYIVALGGDRLVYRKSHLGAIERSSFSRGDELPVAIVGGVSVGVQLCWESHVPDIATTLRAQGAELLLCPHAVGMGGLRRIELWRRHLAARAQDNGMFVVACNALRLDRRQDEGLGFGDGQGGGLVAFGPDGALIDSYRESDEHMMVVSVGGVLPRESSSESMAGISYFDRRRPELYHA